MSTVPLDVEDGKDLIEDFLTEISKGGGRELDQIISQAKMAINEFEYAEEELRSSLGNLNDGASVNSGAMQQQ